MTPQDLRDFTANSERDPLMCASYNLIAKFYPAIAKASTPASPHPATDAHHSSFLWQSIYPKNKSGKPYFNIHGKYCVRLYMAGKWRKVTITDVLPLGADGRPAIASSYDIYELWPTILAKAVYTVYTACGYVSLALP